MPKYKGNDGRENGGYNKILYSPLELLSGESDEVKAYLGSDLEAIQEPTDLHLVVMMGYNDFLFAKLLDLNIKPGTTVTSKDATAISTIDATDANAPFYDLQGGLDEVTSTEVRMAGRTRRLRP